MSTATVVRGFTAINAAKAQVLRTAPARFATTILNGFCRRGTVLGDKGVQYGGHYVLGYEASISDVSRIQTEASRNLIGVSFNVTGEASCCEEYNEDAAAEGSAVRFVSDYVAGASRLFRSITASGAESSPFHRFLNMPDISVRNISSLLSKTDRSGRLSFAGDEPQNCLADVNAAFEGYAEEVMNSLITAAANGFLDHEKSAWSHTAALINYGVSGRKGTLFGLNYEVLGIGRSDEDRGGDVAAISDETIALCNLLKQGLQRMTFEPVDHKMLPSGLSGFRHVFLVGTQSDGN